MKILPLQAKRKGLNKVDPARLFVNILVSSSRFEPKVAFSGAGLKTPLEAVSSSKEKESQSTPLVEVPLIGEGEFVISIGRD